MIDRRKLVAGCAAGWLVAAAPARSAETRDRDLVRLLDEIAAGLGTASLPAPGAAEGARRLAAFSPEGLSPMRRLEREVVLQGLQAEAAAVGGGYGPLLELAYGAPVAPQAARSRLIAEARRCERRADALMRARGLSQGAVAARFETLLNDPALLYPETDAGRRQAVADMNAAMAKLRPLLGAAFGDLPLMTARVEGLLPGEQARKDPQAGVYHVDVERVRARPRWTLASAAYHEATPGHLVQTPLQIRAGAHPLRERYCAGVLEGWSIYAEQLAADLGVHRDDPLGELGYLHWRLFRLARAVADLGIGGGWSDAQAVSAMAELQGPAVYWTTLEADAARVRGDPARRAAEALSGLDLAAWRPKSRSAWPAYHRAILAEGPWPARTLRQRLRS